MKRLLISIILTIWILSFSSCASIFDSGVKTAFSSLDLQTDVACKLKDVIDASWIYYENELKWPTSPNDIKGINLDYGKCLDLSIYDYLCFKIDPENILLVNFSLKPYEFKSEENEITFYTSKIIGILRFHPSLVQNRPDAWIRFVQFEAEGERPGFLIQHIKVISQSDGEILYSDFISRLDRIKDDAESGT